MSDGRGAPVDVAVGVVLRDDGAFLVAERPAGKPMAGYWEFPGGKLEAGESVFDALVREFDEELSLAIVAAHPWVQRVVVYPHATVRLHFWRSVGDGRGWRGAPRANEGQAFRWERIERITTAPWLPGALPARRWLRLPPLYAISDAARRGVDAFLVALDARLEAPAPPALLQLREPALDDDAFARLFAEVRARCRAHDVRLVVNGAHAERWWAEADGVHLRARDLMARATRPAVDWCLASTHDAVELAHAADLDVDAAVLGPVRPTVSHPDAAGIGWDGFARIVAATAVPVYALGGLARADLPAAVAAGAHGVAMIRAAWDGPVARGVAAGQADAGQADAGQADAGRADAGEADAGEADAAEADAAEADAGEADADEADADDAARP